MRYGIFITLLGITAAITSADTPTTDDLRQQLQQANQRLDQQQQELAQLRAAVGQSWLDDARKQQVRELVREVLADADSRAALIDTPITAGHDGGFFVTSGDGNFLLRVKGMLQARYLFNGRDDSGGDDNRGGFDIGRTRFGFTGHVVDPTWQFMIWTGHHYDGTDMLLDAWIRKDLGAGWSVTAGQFKLPFLREWLVSETKQQFVTRSLHKGMFAGGYTQGVKIDYVGDRLRGVVSFNDGAGAINTSWNTEDTEYAFSARGELLLLAGHWKQYAEFESWPGEDFAAVLGAATHYQMGEYGTATDEAESVRWTADAMLEFGGANLFAAVVGNHIDNGASMDQYGVLVQGGLFVTEKLELIARYEWGDADTGGDETLSIATVGANYFFAKHQLRLTADVSYAFEPVSSAWASSFAGYLSDAPGRDGQVVVRTQIQLVF